MLVSVALTTSARVGEPPPSLRLQVLPKARVNRLALPPTDVAAELEADRGRTDPFPLRYAVSQTMAVTPATHGTWEQVTNGRLWRLRIASVGATDLNLGFSKFWLPAGAALYIKAESESYFQGPYTALDNKPHGQLWTPLVPGEEAVIELFVPAQVTQEAQILLSHVGTGYRDLFHRKAGNIPKSGSCNIDVVCPQAAAWTNEIRSVALYSISGVEICTGTLVTDAAVDFRNYFLTANHCGLNSVTAASVVVYWNYQSPICGQHGGGSLAQNQNGAVFRAAKHDVDFALIELDEMPDPSFNVYYSGWDRSGAAPAGCVGIHHPGTGEKSISLCSNALATINSCISTGGSNTHWQVFWSAGVTEPGSSGSAIWDSATHRVVGTLSGGGSSCFSPASPDCYGKLSVAWDSGKSSTDRLRDWLDPQDSGVTNVPGADPMQSSIIRSAGTSLISESFSPTNGAVDPGELVLISFALRNLGGVATTNLVTTLLATGGVTLPGAPKNYGVLPQCGSAVSRTFSFTANGDCGGTITPVFQLQDGARNLGTVIFGLTLGVATPLQVMAQGFDGVAAPTLPAGWTSSIIGSGTAWATSTAQADSWPNAVFAADPGAITDNRLLSPTVIINSTGPQLTFRHRYDMENGYDGGVLEISIKGGAFTDILGAGGLFVTNGYTGALSTYYQNPLAGRQAWSGNSAGFVTTVVNLPAAADGAVQLRWRLGSDNSAGAAGWYVDTVSLTQPVYHCCAGLVQPVIVNPRILEPASMVFSYDSITGQTYLIEATTNLAIPAGWIVIQTNLGNGSTLSATNATTDSGQRYFRVRTQ